MTRQVPRQARAPISERPAGPLTAQCLAIPGDDAMRFFVGIDWASRAHAVCIIDQTGRVRWQGSVPHTAQGLPELVGRLRRFRGRGGLRVALERPSGLLVDTLVDAGLERVWPGAAAIFVDVDSAIALAFLARYPTPHSAARLGEKRLAQFLGQHAYSGRRPVVELLARLRTAPASQVGEAEAEASGDLVRALVAVLTPLVGQLQQLSAAIEAALAQ